METFKDATTNLNTQTEFAVSDVWVVYNYYYYACHNRGVYKNEADARK